MIARSVRIGIVAGCLVTVMPLAAGSALAQTPIRPGFNLFSVNQDQEIGRQSATEAERQLPLLHDRSIEAYVNAVGKRLAAVAPGAKYPYQFKVVNASDINAFALPGGYLYLNRGLIEAAKTEGQLVGVMAHEMAHVALRHGTNQASKAYVGQTGLGLLAGLVEKDDRSMQKTVAAVGGFGMNAVFLKFSRTAEEQADVVGAQMMAKAGYDPADMVAFFDMLADKSTHEPSKVEQFFSSHPAPANRAARINQETAMLTVAPTRTVGGFAAARSELLAMRPAASMKQISEGKALAPAAPATWVAGRSLSGIDIAGPSTQYRVFQQRERLFRIEYPANWRVYEPSQGHGVTIAPEGGFVDAGGVERDLVYGVVVNNYEPFGDEVDDRFGLSRGAIDDGEQLARATNDLLGQVLRANPNLELLRGSERRDTIDGAPSLSLVLSGRSPLTRQEERVTVFTREIAADRIIYALFIAPMRDYEGLNATFNRMISSLQVGEDTTYRSDAGQGSGGSLTGARNLTVPAGTVLTVALEQTLSTATSQADDRFTARVVEPVMVGGQVAIATGSIVSGRVVQALESKKVGGHAQLDLQFTELKLASGARRPIAAAFYGEGKSQSGKDAATIGGAAAGGAVLGRIFGKDSKSTVLGALVGGALGTGIAATNRGEDVTLPQGIAIDIQLVSPFTM